MADSQIDKQGTEEFRSPTEKKAEWQTSRDVRSFPGNTRDDFTLISCEVCHSAKKPERKRELESEFNSTMNLCFYSRFSVNLVLVLAELQSRLLKCCFPFRQKNRICQGRKEHDNAERKHGPHPQPLETRPQSYPG